MKRNLCLLLALLLILSAVLGLSSCKKDGEGDGGEETTVATTSGEASESDKLYERLPTGNYGGYTFTILNAESNYALTTIVPTETEDSLSQALFQRNSVVKEKLNIDIVEVSRPYPSYTTVQEEVRKLNSSNTFAYDAIFNEVAAQTQLSQEGAYLAVEDYEAYLDLSSPWWFTDAMESLKIDGMTCELFGDFHLMYYESVEGMAFNQKKFSENHIDYPYELVRQGKWTVSEFKEIISIFNSETSTSGHYGLVAPKDFCTAMITSSDFSLVERDEEAILMAYENDEVLVGIYETLLTFYESNGDGQANWIHPDYDSTAYQSGLFAEERQAGGALEIFSSGRAAVFAETIGGLRPLRESEFDYGIVPFPKNSTDQRDYVNFIYSGAASCGIPTTSEDLERTCTVLENLAAFSHKYVKNEYYEIVVQLRTVRDSDSIEMLDIIFGHAEKSTTKFELDLVYSIGLATCIRVNLSDAKTEIKSQLDSIKRTSVDTNIKNVIKAYER